MNNFKKFVAVLLGVVMACVFATSAFAADFSKLIPMQRLKVETWLSLPATASPRLTTLSTA